MKNKKVIISIIIIVALAIILGSIYLVKNNKKEENEKSGNGVVVQEEFRQILEDGTKINTSEELKTTKNIDGLEITNIQLIEKNGETILTAEVKNTTDKETEIMGINIIVLDKEGKEIGKIPGVISSLGAGETKQLNIGITEDYSDAYNFKVEKQ